jgi:hypothetical protein
MKSGLTVTVDWDTAEQIMEAHLLNTYHELTEEVKKLKAKNKLKDFEAKDLEMYERVLGGIEMVSEWYIFDFDKKK